MFRSDVPAVGRRPGMIALGLMAAFAVSHRGSGAGGAALRQRQPVSTSGCSRTTAAWC